MASKPVSDESFETPVLKFTILVLIALTILVASYFIFFWNNPVSQNPDSWGTFGDYVGGIGGTLVSIGALVLLATSVQIQRTELRKTTIALEEARDAQKALTVLQIGQAKLAALQALLVSHNADIAMMQERTKAVRQEAISAYGGSFTPNDSPYGKQLNSMARLTQEMINRRNETAERIISSMKELDLDNAENLAPIGSELS